LKRLIITILLINFLGSLFSQELSNFRSTWKDISSDTIKLDTLSIVPGSVLLFDENNTLIPDSLYDIDHPASLLILKTGAKDRISKVKISYRVMPFDLSEKYFHKDISNIMPSSGELTDPYKYTYSKSDYDDFFGRDKIDRRGSISRGITFGNNQDLAVNSNLNLQLSGKLTDDLEIMAAISDNNIPIQPDGNSQQIQEFDKVYIQLFNKRMNLIVGDFEIKRPTGYFLNMYKKVQGGMFSSAFDLDKEKKSTLRTTVSGAVAKGKYNRMSFTGTEGNQGPYKLRGAENESYIIVLAGTEKVFIDGKLLSRGQENDYVIDYNTAELSFTPNQPITKDKRIIVEFEYSEKNYARFLVFNSNEFLFKKSKYWINIFSEQDSKNQPLQQDLDDSQKQTLASVGDSLNQALVPNVDSVGFDNDIVLYAKRDTVVGLDTFEIYVYSTNPDSAFYRLGFSYVGDNNGNYNQITSSANGKVFQWTAPVGGVPQGGYEPVVLLVTPKKKQVVTAGGITQITSTTKADFEIAVSNNDINTFSSKHSEDNIGLALKMGILQEIPFKDTSNVKLFTSARYQLINKYFDPVERFRSVEFERDWNLTTSNEDEHEHLVNVSVDFLRKNLGAVKLRTDMMNRENGYNAIKNGLDTRFEKKGFILDIDGSLLNSDDNINETFFLRHQASLAKELPFITIGVREDQEYNEWKKIANDSLLGNSFSFYRWEVFVNNADTAKNKLFASYKNRKDYMPYNNKLKYTTLGEDISAGFHLMKNPNNTLKNTFTYRKLTIEDTSLTTNKAENSLTGRIEYQLRLFKTAITTSTYYEIGSGLEVKREFSYVETAPGQGVYSWTDYNENGIKELDEFEVANFQDEANYIRVFTPTDDYIKVYSNQFNQLLNIRPDKVWKKKKGVKKYLSRFSDQFAFRVSKRNTDDNFYNYANPFNLSVNDSTVISTGTSLRNTFSFNKTSSSFGIDYFIQDNKNRMLLVNGIDTRTGFLNGARVRVNISKTITLINNFNIGEKTYSSEYFSTKDYNIEYYSDDATVSFQPNLKLRISMMYKIADKENTLNVEMSESHDFGAEIKYNILTKGNLLVKANYINLSFTDNETGEQIDNTNSPVAYTMLEGFLPGDNITWSVMLQRSLSNSLQLNLTYNGRVSEGGSVIHTGGMQLRATF